MKRAIIAGLALSLLGTAVPSAGATFPGNTGRVVVRGKFDGKKPFGFNYLTLRRDWTDPQPLTRLPGADARWSPDGQWVAYSGSVDPDEPVRPNVIWLANADGTGARILTSPTTGAPAYEYDFGPTWAADSKSILFVRGRGTAPYVSHIRAVDVTTSTETQLTTGTFMDLYPEWSPDGATLAFVRCSQVNQGFFFTSGVAVTCAGADIQFMNSEGQISASGRSTDRDEAHLDWSPDGKRLAFTCDGDTTNQNDGRGGICILNARSGNSRKIYGSRNIGMLPRWTPGGVQIFFSVWPRTEENTDNEIYSIRPDGSRLRRVTNNHKNDPVAVQWLAR